MEEVQGILKDQVLAVEIVVLFPCMMQFVQNVRKLAKYLLDQQMRNQFIVVTVLQKEVVQQDLVQVTFQEKILETEMIAVRQ